MNSKIYNSNKSNNNNNNEYITLFPNENGE